MLSALICHFEKVEEEQNVPFVLILNENNICLNSTLKAFKLF